MSKGLEALEKICLQGCKDRDELYYLQHKNCKQSEENKKYYPFCSGCIYCGEDKKIIEKELKALEILKKRLFNNENFDYLAWNNSYICIDGNVDLTQEEYDLLKEVLL